MHKSINDDWNKRRHPKSAILPPHFLSTLSWVGNAFFIVHFTCSHQYCSRRLSNAIFFLLLLWFFLIYLCSLLLIPFLSLCSLQILKCRPRYGISLMFLQLDSVVVLIGSIALVVSWAITMRMHAFISNISNRVSLSLFSESYCWCANWGETTAPVVYFVISDLKLLSSKIPRESQFSMSLLEGSTNGFRSSHCICEYTFALAIKDTNSMQTHSIKLLRSDHTEMKSPGTKGMYVTA